jgi:hypothetical protein
MQITKSQFKTLIVVQLVIGIGSAVLSFFTTALLPIALQTYVNESLEQDLSSYQIIVFTLALVVALWALQNLIALYQFKSYAPKHLLYITIISPVFYFGILDAVVYTSIDAYLNDLLFMLAGATLALSFYSNIASEFSTTKALSKTE